MAQVVVELTGDEQKLLKSYQKVRDSQNQMDKGLKNIKGSARGAGKAAQGAGRQMQESFGAKAKGMILSYAAGFASMQTAMTGVRTVMQAMREDSERTLSVFDKMIESGRELNQVMSGEERDRAAIRRDILAVETGVPANKIEAMQFARKSVGLSKSGVRDIARLAGANVVTPEAGLAAAAQIPPLFREFGLTPQQSLSAAAIGSAKSKASFREYTEGLMTTGGGAAAFGMSPAETFGMLSILPERFAGIVPASKRMRALTLKLAARGGPFEGKSLLESFQMMQADEGLRESFLKENQELREAYGAMEKIGAKRMAKRVETMRESIEKAGTPESVIAERIAEATDPTTKEGAKTRAWRSKRIAEREQEVVALRNAEQVLGLEEYKTRRATEEKRRGVDPLVRGIRGKIREAASWMKSPTELTDVISKRVDWNVYKALDVFGAYEAVGRQMRGETGEQENIAQELKEAARAQTEAADNLNDAASNTRRQREAAQGVPE